MSDEDDDVESLDAEDYGEEWSGGAGAAGAMFNPAMGMGMGGPMGMNVGMGGYGPMGATVGEDGKVCSPRRGAQGLPDQGP